MRKVAVVFGGESYENEISILTGVFVLNVLDREKFQPVPVYIHTDGKTYSSAKMSDLQYFKSGAYTSSERIFFENGDLYALNSAKKRVKKLAKIDAILNCCHGGLGEGGGVSALAKWNHLPLASPDLTASGVFMDKCLTKLMMRALGVPTVEYIRVNERDYKKRGAFLLKNIETRLKYPVIIKPAHLGSSLGISLASSEAEAKQAIEKAFELDDRVLIERYLKDKRDINCGAYMLGGEIFVSEPEEAFGAGVYSFEDKYVKRKSDDLSQKGGGRVLTNAELREKIRAYTKTVYKRMNLRGVVRMDFLVAENRAYLCEVNTVPGSLAYYLFCERISDAKTFFTDLIEDAIVSYKESEKKIVTTGILSSVRVNRK